MGAGNQGMQGTNRCWRPGDAGTIRWVQGTKGWGTKRYQGLKNAGSREWVQRTKGYWGPRDAGDQRRQGTKRCWGSWDGCRGPRDSGTKGCVQEIMGWTHATRACRGDQRIILVFLCTSPLYFLGPQFFGITIVTPRPEVPAPAAVGSQAGSSQTQAASYQGEVPGCPPSLCLPKAGPGVAYG